MGLIWFSMRWSSGQDGQALRKGPEGHPEAHLTARCFQAWVIWRLYISFQGSFITGVIAGPTHFHVNIPLRFRLNVTDIVWEQNTWNIKTMLLFTSLKSKMVEVLFLEFLQREIGTAVSQEIGAALFPSHFHNLGGGGTRTACCEIFQTVVQIYPSC